MNEDTKNSQTKIISKFQKKREDKVVVSEESGQLRASG